MFLSFPVIYCVFIASAVLADRSGSLDGVDHVTSQNPIRQSPIWAGAVWSQNASTFSHITGSFTVPVMSGQTNSAATAWVGIDGNTCPDAILQAGIAFTANGDMGGTYEAWYRWYPGIIYSFSDLIIAAGDDVTLTVQAFSSTSGMVRIKNSSNGQSARGALSSEHALCGKDAEWVVGDPLALSGGPSPLANFGTVAFHHCHAGDQIHHDKYSAAGATIYDMRQNGNLLASVSADGDSVTIAYVTNG